MYTVIPLIADALGIVPKHYNWRCTTWDVRRLIEIQTTFYENVEKSTAIFRRLALSISHKDHLMSTLIIVPRLRIKEAMKHESNSGTDCNCIIENNPEVAGRTENGSNTEESAREISCYLICNAYYYNNWCSNPITTNEINYKEVITKYW